MSANPPHNNIHHRHHNHHSRNHHNHHSNNNISPNGLAMHQHSQLTQAIKQHDHEEIQQLLDTKQTQIIHQTKGLTNQSSSLTPLQVAIDSDDSGKTLYALLNEYFQNAIRNATQPQDLANVLCEITQQIFPSFCLVSTPSSLLPFNNDPLSIQTRMSTALAAIQRGEFIVATDSHDRENEGDLIIAAQHVTAAKIAFMVNHTSGLICVGMTAAECERLELPQMVEHNTESHHTAFTVSVDYRGPNMTTGISAADRACTIQHLASTHSQPADFARPGHVFPLRAVEGGVLKRAGHTEASVDITCWAGCQQAAAMCEIVKSTGDMMRPQELRLWSERYGIPQISIEDMQYYSRIRQRKIVS